MLRIGPKKSRGWRAVRMPSDSLADEVYRKKREYLGSFSFTSLIEVDSPNPLRNQIPTKAKMRKRANIRNEIAGRISTRLGVYSSERNVKYSTESRPEKRSGITLHRTKINGRLAVSNSLFIPAFALPITCKNIATAGSERATICNEDRTRSTFATIINSLNNPNRKTLGFAGIQGYT